MVLHLDRGEKMGQRFLLRRLAEMQYTRNEVELHRATYRVRGDIIDVYPAESEREGIRVELFDDEIETISIFEPVDRGDIQTGPAYHNSSEVSIMLPSARSFWTPLRSSGKNWSNGWNNSAGTTSWSNYNGWNKRTRFDLEMMMEIGYCSGIENYSRHLSGRRPGEPPPTLFDYLPHNALLVVDESHVTIPQLGAMYRGDRSRKEKPGGVRFSPALRAGQSAIAL